jgi:hypothetical protein
MLVIMYGQLNDRPADLGRHSDRVRPDVGVVGARMKVIHRENVQPQYQVSDDYQREYSAGDGPARWTICSGLWRIDHICLLSHTIKEGHPNDQREHQNQAAIEQRERPQMTFEPGTPEQQMRCGAKQATGHYTD